MLFVVTWEFYLTGTLHCTSRGPCLSYSDVLLTRITRITVNSYLSLLFFFVGNYDAPLLFQKKDPKGHFVFSPKSSKDIFASFV